jgi:hypothetical protein
MTEPDRTELVASLAENQMQFQHAVSQLTNRLNNADWHAALDAIAELRTAEAHLEARLKALAEENDTHE